MAREASVKVRLTEKEDKFLNEKSAEMQVSRSEYIRILLQKEMLKQEDT